MRDVNVGQRAPSRDAGPHERLLLQQLPERRLASWRAADLRRLQAGLRQPLGKGYFCPSNLVCIWFSTVVAWLQAFLVTRFRGSATPTSWLFEGIARGHSSKYREFLPLTNPG